MKLFKMSSLNNRVNFIIYITTFLTLITLRVLIAYLYSFGLDVMSITINFIVIVPIGFIVILIMRRITKVIIGPIVEPINELALQIEKISNDEIINFSESDLKISDKAPDEVYLLYKSTEKLFGRLIKYNEMITQSEKMVSVGQLTAAITHEINTPLGAIKSNNGIIKMLVDSIKESTPENDRLEHILDAARLSEDASDRINDIIRNLKIFTRIDQADFEYADINLSIMSVVALTSNLYKDRISVVTEYGDLPKVSCHLGLLNQVFMNLFVNAIQAITGPGEIKIKTSFDDINIYVSITDNGCGILDKDLINIFRYGYTTKQPGSGSGIGLALSNNIIKKHSGSICVHSKKNEGSEFEVILPREQPL